MQNSDSYRRKAGECLLHAERSITAEDKSRWLQLAEAWQRLADRIEDPSFSTPPEDDGA